MNIPGLIPVLILIFSILFAGCPGYTQAENLLTTEPLTSSSKDIHTPHIIVTTPSPTGESNTTGTTKAIQSSSGKTLTYSLVHLSDTQNLAALYPETYDYTFSYLDSLQEQYNISAIIITGDLVNSWKKKEEWDAYAHAVNKTSIPVFVTFGNHDMKSGENFTYFDPSDNRKKWYVTSVNDFDLVGINYVSKSLSSNEFAGMRQSLVNSSHSFTIIATHYYMDTDGSLSLLGSDIDKKLIIRPTIVMAGHRHISVMREKTVGKYPVIEDLTNYQDGFTGDQYRENYSAGTLYTVTARDGVVEKISSKTIWIYPNQSFGREQVLYDS